jgi:hypothetical protein
MVVSLPNDKTHIGDRQIHKGLSCMDLFSYSVLLSLLSLRKRRHHLDALFFIQVYRGDKSCTSLLENVSLRIAPSNLRDFPLFGSCPSNKHCPSAWCALAANAMGKRLDIFAIGAISLNHIYTH